ncbi:MAG: phytochelatin synthase family protein [Pseudomonadota bacterium]
MRNRLPYSMRVKFIAMLILGLTMMSGINLPANEPAKYGPAGTPYAVPLSHDHKYLQDSQNTAVDYWNLAPFYVPQLNDLSCSVASVSMVLNGIVRAGRSLKAEDTNVTQSKLIETVNAVNWKERVMPGGFHGEVGLTLDQLEAVVKQALRQYEVSNYEIDRVEVTNADATALEKFRHALAANEKNGRDFILIHFLQDVVTEAQGGPYPHISPIGAYDETRKRVLVMDVDREWYEPYWVFDERLLLAMSKKTERYGLGGYLWIRTKS